MIILIVISMLIIVATHWYDVEATNAMLASRRFKEANPVTRFLMKYLGNMWWLPKLFLVPIALWAVYVSTLALIVLTGLHVALAIYLWTQVRKLMGN